MKNFIYSLSIILSLCDDTAAHATAHDDQAQETATLHHTQRPHSVASQINNAFRYVRTKYLTQDRWGWNGQDTTKHGFLYVRTLATELIRHTPLEQKDFYIVNLGAGYFRKGSHDSHGWGWDLAKHVCAIKDIRPDLTVHIISTAGEEHADFIPVYGKEYGQCRLYELLGFQAEHFSDAIGKRMGEHIHNAIDLLVTRMTLPHLVDPVGTFKQLHDDLRPGTGLLCGDSFQIMCKKYPANSYLEHNFYETHIEAHFPIMLSFLRDTKAPFLCHIDGRTPLSPIVFVLKRKDASPCALPLAYDDIEYQSRESLGTATSAWASYHYTPHWDDGKASCDQALYLSMVSPNTDLTSDFSSVTGDHDFITWLKEKMIIEDFHPVL